MVGTGEVGRERGGGKGEGRWVGSDRMVGRGEMVERDKRVGRGEVGGER